MINDELNLLSTITKRQRDQSIESDRSQLQRRNKVVDLFGIEYTRQGDTSHPATFYLSVSQDLIYYERFEFKIIIQPFAMPIGGNGSTGMASAQVRDTSLSISGGNINPNPHGHVSVPHNHSLDAGVSLFTSSVSDFELWIEDINLTPYLKAQFGGKWIDGEGVFPEKGIINYDILKAIPYMPTWQQGLILSSGYKKVELRGKGVFNATLVNYTKYSHVNR